MLTSTLLKSDKFAAYELGELRAHYQEEIAMMRIVCNDVVVAAEQLGINTDVLKREQQEIGRAHV